MLRRMQESSRPAPRDISEYRRVQLRNKRALATGLLLIAVAIFLGLRLDPHPGFANRLIGAAAEAAIVGGLADWFAITALFRHPLGLPIPHTALIPSRKDEIGRSLGNFVRDSFLDRELLTERLRRKNRAAQIAQWLDTPATADFIAGRVVAMMAPLLNGLNDAEIHTFVRTFAAQGIRRIDIVPITDALLDDLIATGKHMDIADALLAIAGPSLHALKGPIIERVGERTGRFFPSYFDRKIGQGIVGGLEAWLNAVRTPASAERTRLDGWIRGTIAELRAAPEYPNLLARAQRAIATNPALLQASGTVWDELKRELLADSGSASPQTAVMAARVVRTFGRLLQQMPVVQDYLNAAIENVLIDYIAPWRLQIGTYISETIQSWDGPKVADVIESHVGGDLQYVRINGTLVGAAIGAALFLIGAGIETL
jgi:uncharacterized membrane-anchored protein YjiN (DUF445 family)